MSDKSNRPWNHLPNAALIDRVLADLRDRPEVWAASGHAARAMGAAWAAVGDAALDVAWDAALAAAWAAMRNSALEAAWAAARPAAVAWAWVATDATLALIAWDDCAHLLHTDPEQVLMLALLGHPPAVLLYPACVALQKSSQINDLHLLSFG